jgi:ketosteroid isomerase-like protein
MKAEERQALVDAFEARDLGRFLELVDPDVVWHGLAWPDDPEAICHDRTEVRHTFEAYPASGGTGSPEIVAESEDAVVIDPHPEPLVEGMENLHHIYAFRDGRIVMMQDYPDRRSALDALGLARLS